VTDELNVERLIDIWIDRTIIRIRMVFGNCVLLSFHDSSLISCEHVLKVLKNL